MIATKTTRKINSLTLTSIIGTLTSFKILHKKSRRLIDNNQTAARPI
jgi:hypothetical protein